MNEIKNVLVLLSTYNGEKYLDEQISSLVKQKGVNIHILIRDDGSTDKTVIKLNEFSLKYNNITLLIEKNIGCALSFNKLIEYAVSNMNYFDYYAFCDQDDVWEEDKLQAAVSSLEIETLNPLKLYISSYTIVDENLKLKYIKRLNLKLTLGESLIMINTLGCTQVFSKKLLKLALKRIKIEESNLNNMPNHDGWLYLVAIINNAYIFNDYIPHILYRQHSSNVMGINQGSFLNRFKRTLKGKNVKSDISKILLKTFENIDEETKDLLILNSIYRFSYKSKLKLIFSKKMTTNSISLNIAYRLLLLFNYF